MTAKMTIHKLFESSKMEKTNKMMQFLIFLESIEMQLVEINQTLKMMQNEEFKKEKRSKKEKSNSLNLGGIIGGESIGEYEGKREGGGKGGDFENGNALKDYPDESKEFVSKMILKIGTKHGERHLKHLQTREQFLHSLKAFGKLQKKGYGQKEIEQAIFNAFNDGFWQEKFKHFKQLANTSNNGALVIENLLAINAKQTKMSIPIMAQYKG